VVRVAERFKQSSVSTTMSDEDMRFGSPFGVSIGPMITVGRPLARRLDFSNLHCPDTTQIPLSPSQITTTTAKRTMLLLRPATRLLTNSRARLQIVTNPSLTTRRALTSTAARSAGDHAHEDQYDSPSGWLFGVKPGEKYENEGWENVWYYGFFGSCLFGVIGYCYKPDTRYVLNVLVEGY